MNDGQTQRIDIVITDKGADVARSHIVSIGQAAVISGTQVDALNKKLGQGSNNNSLTQAAKAQSAFQLSIEKTALSYLKQESALNRAIVAEQKASQAAIATTIQQNKLTISNNAVQMSYLNVEKALNDAVRSEAAAGLASARLAEFNDKQAASAARAAAAELEKASAVALAADAMIRQVGAATAYDRAQAINEARQGGFVVPDRLLPQNRPASTGGGGSLNTKTTQPGLDAFTKGTGQAADNVDKLGKRIGLTNNEMVNLGYQMQDIAVSLAGGQNPFLVLLQQGGQIQGIYSRRGEGIGAVFSDISGILLKMVTPARLVAVALAAGAIAFKSFASDARDITETAKVLQTTTDNAQALGGALRELSNGKLGFSNLKTDVTDFGVALSNAARNGDSQLARLWKDNGLSITKANGQVKDINDLLDDASRLVRNAKTEFDKIEITRIIGLSEDWVKVLERGPKVLEDAKTKVTQTGGVMNAELIARASQFDKAWDTSWTKFTTNAGKAITQVKGFIADLVLNGSQGIAAMINPTLRDPTTYGLGPQGALGQAQALNGGSVASGLTADQQAAVNARIAQSQGGPDARLPHALGSVADANNSLVTALNNLVLPAGSSVGGYGTPANSNTGRDKTIPSRPTNERPDNVGAPTVSDLLPTGKDTVVSGSAKPKVDHTEEKRADAIAKVNRELDSQIKLYGMIGPERDAEQKYQDINNQLLTKKITLSATETTQIKDKITLIQQQNDVQQQLDRIYNDSTEAQKNYNDVLAASNKLLADGKINQKDYAKAVGDAKIAVLEQSESISDGVDLAFLKIKQSQETLSSSVSDTLIGAVTSAGDALTNFAATGTISFSNFTQSILADVAKLVVQFAILRPLMSALGLGGGAEGFTVGGGTATDSLGNVVSNSFYDDPAAGGGIGEFLSGIVSSLGFAGGGSFTAGGSGKVDGTPVAMNVTKGERVTVETPAQQMRSAASGVNAPNAQAKVDVNIDNSGSTGVEVQDKGTRANPDGSKTIDLLVKRIKGEMASDIRKGGNQLSGAIGDRFGLSAVAGNKS